MDNPDRDDDKEGGTSTVPTGAAAPSPTRVVLVCEEDEARSLPFQSKMPPPFSMEVPKPSRKAADRNDAAPGGGNGGGGDEASGAGFIGLITGKGRWGKAINKVLIAEELSGGGKKKRPKIGVGPRVFVAGTLILILFLLLFFINS